MQEKYGVSLLRWGYKKTGASFLGAQSLSYYSFLGSKLPYYDQYYGEAFIVRKRSLANSQRQTSACKQHGNELGIGFFKPFWFKRGL